MPSSRIERPLTAFDIPARESGQQLKLQDRHHQHRRPLQKQQYGYQDHHHHQPHELQQQESAGFSLAAADAAGTSPAAAAFSRTFSSSKNHQHHYQQQDHQSASASAAAGTADAALHGSDERLLLHLLIGLLREVRVNRSGGAASLVDRPHHQRLTSAAVPRRENAFCVRAEVPIRRVDVLALIGKKKIATGTQTCRREEQEGEGGGLYPRLLQCIAPACH